MDAQQAIDYLLDLFRRRAMLDELKSKPLQLITAVFTVVTAILARMSTNTPLYANGPAEDPFGESVKELGSYLEVNTVGESQAAGGLLDDWLLQMVVEKLIAKLLDYLSKADKDPQLEGCSLGASQTFGVHYELVLFLLTQLARMLREYLEDSEEGE